MHFTMNYRPCQFCIIVCINITFTMRTVSHMKYTSNTHPLLEMFPSPHCLSCQPLTKPLSSVSVATGGELQHYVTYGNVLKNHQWTSPGAHLGPFQAAETYLPHSMHADRLSGSLSSFDHCQQCYIDISVCFQFFWHMPRNKKFYQYHLFNAT